MPSLAPTLTSLAGTPAGFWPKLVAVAARLSDTGGACASAALSADRNVRASRGSSHPHASFRL
ncbi:hypothetical protein PR003_g2611 [Phytophthora rubi]|uniref:Uncharacterized protein n=1 Tax=Phytophthora rubi TaxID=129364 RepID=A0A6A4G1G6_9STRA|nr:hypothetical protein PR001_g26829 [Phytophthora rubi]KAE9045123.1 hypothetical protein PR002_g2396 [Phytophthora rubi]KAE9355852.1 hypothetical protein PR003_g2611 [Phytophthora rubi]